MVRIFSQKLENPEKCQFTINHKNNLFLKIDAQGSLKIYQRSFRTRRSSISSIKTKLFHPKIHLKRLKLKNGEIVENRSWSTQNRSIHLILESTASTKLLTVLFLEPRARKLLRRPRYFIDKNNSLEADFLKTKLESHPFSTSPATPDTFGFGYPRYTTNYLSAAHHFPKDEILVFCECHVIKLQNALFSTSPRYWVTPLFTIYSKFKKYIYRKETISLYKLFFYNDRMDLRPIGGGSGKLRVRKMTTSMDSGKNSRTDFDGFRWVDLDAPRSLRTPRTDLNASKMNWQAADFRMKFKIENYSVIKNYCLTEMVFVERRQEGLEGGKHMLSFAKQGWAGLGSSKNAWKLDFRDLKGTKVKSISGSIPVFFYKQRLQRNGMWVCQAEKELRFSLTTPKIQNLRKLKKSLFDQKNEKNGPPGVSLGISSSDEGQWTYKDLIYINGKHQKKFQIFSVENTPTEILWLYYSEVFIILTSHKTPKHLTVGKYHKKVKMVKKGFKIFDTKFSFICDNHVGIYPTGLQKQAFRIHFMESVNLFVTVGYSPGSRNLRIISSFFADFKLFQVEKIKELAIGDNISLTIFESYGFSSFLDSYGNLGVMYPSVNNKGSFNGLRVLVVDAELKVVKRKIKVSAGVSDGLELTFLKFNSRYCVFRRVFWGSGWRGGGKAGIRTGKAGRGEEYFVLSLKEPFKAYSVVCEEGVKFFSDIGLFFVGNTPYSFPVDSYLVDLGVGERC